jgi:sortase A
MARLRIPAIDVDLPIYHGTSDATLLKGVGHLEGTSLPVGGEGTHSVLTGHRGLASATLFTNLDKVKEGDTFTIEVLDQVLTYQVIRTQVVDPSDTASLRATAGEDLVTLVTCTPLGINSQRILVTGERITPTPQEDLDAAGSVPDIPGFPWWAAGLAAGVVLVGVFVWRAGYPRTPRRAGRTAARPGGVDAPE